MCASFSQDKGKRAEREVVKLLQPVVTKVCSELGISDLKLERNLMQSIKGGYDITGIDSLALEVKHQETLAVDAWWNQCLRQAGDNRLPVLLYKQNRQRFKVRVIGFLAAGSIRVKAPVDITLDVFLIYFEHWLRSELTP